MITTMITTLPDLPSELIRLALKDLELCENDNKYFIDMDWWHCRRFDGSCSVCLAGSVMAKTLDTPLVNAFPEDFASTGTEMKLLALNQFRGGVVKRGLQYLGVVCDEVDNFAPTDYARDAEGFKREMELLASRLEAVGL
jgi:hypothetical protein